MHVFIKPSLDSAIYSDNKYQNTSNDQILELVKTKNTYYTSSNDLFVSRILTYFDLNQISNVISTYNIPVPSTSSIINSTESNFIFKMYVANSDNLIRNKNILALYPISSSWSQSFGTRSDLEIVSDGVSWYSSSNSSWNLAGGDYINDPLFECNSILDTNTDEITDLSANVNKIIYGWYYDILDLQNHPYSFLYDLNFGSNYYDLNSESLKINNYGFIIKRTETQENDDIDYGYVNFYSIKTNTIYSPILDISWDDSVYNFNSSSVQLYTGWYPYAYIRRVKNKYKLNETAEFICKIRDEVYDGSLPTTGSKEYVLDEESYYSIIDLDTGDEVIPFNNHSKISLSGSLNYFKINFENFNTNRLYKILLKTKVKNSYVIFDNEHKFIVEE